MKRYLLFAACCAALLAVPMAVNSQPPGGDFGGGRGRGGRGGPGGGMMGGDPNQFFDFISKGKNVINRADLDPNFQRMFDRIAESQGITNGQISRDQFRAATDSFRNRMRGGPGGAPGGPPGVTVMTTTVKTDDKGMSQEQMDRHAEDAFRKHDKDGDGQLAYGEMPDNLKSVWTTYDTNKDGSINLDEYKSFYRDRMQIRLQEQAQNPGQRGEPNSADGLPPETEAAPAVEEDKRPTVYRFGKLPKDLPPWFAELDTYKDGQIWLSSWVKAGRTVEEFKAMDRNDDGLLTVEEYLGYARANAIKSPGETVVASAGGEERGARPAFAGFGGQPGSSWGRFRGGPGQNGETSTDGGTQSGFGGRRDRGNGGFGGGEGPSRMRGFDRGNRGEGRPGASDAQGGNQNSGPGSQGEGGKEFGGRRGGRGRGGFGPGGYGSDRGAAPPNTSNSKDSPKP